MASSISTDPVLAGDAGITEDLYPFLGIPASITGMDSPHPSERARSCPHAGLGPNVEEECREMWVDREPDPPAIPNVNQSAGYAIASSPDEQTIYAAGVGDYPVAGFAPLNADAVVTALDAETGQTRWTQKFDRDGLYDVAEEIVVGGDGERIFVLGVSESPEDERDLHVWSLDPASGDVLWSGYWDEQGETAERAYTGVLSEEASTLVAVGETREPGACPCDRSTILVAYDAATGDLLWDTVLDVEPSPIISQVAADGQDVYVTGQQTRNGTGVFVGAIGLEDGSPSWTTWTPAEDVGGLFVPILTADENVERVYVAGYNGQDLPVLALDAATGDIAWTHAYSSPASRSFWATGIVAPADSETVAVTGMGSAGGPPEGSSGWDYTTFALDAGTGELRWDAFYHGPSMVNDVAWAMDASPDGERIYVTGESYGLDVTPLLPPYQVDIATVVYDTATGEQLDVARYDGPGNQWDAGLAVEATSGGAYVTGGSPNVQATTAMVTLGYDAPMHDAFPQVS